MYTVFLFSPEPVFGIVFPPSLRSVCVRPRRGDHCHLPWIHFYGFTEDVKTNYLYLYTVMIRGEMVFVSPYGTNHKFNYDNEFLVPP